MQLKCYNRYSLFYIDINVGIELPKYTIQETKQEPNKLIKFLFPLFILIGVLAGYFASGLYANQTIATLQERNHVLEELNAKNQDQIALQYNDISIFKTEKKVKQQATNLLQNDFKGLIESKAELQSEINFYQRLLSPSSENKGLRVFEATLKQQPNQSFQLKLTIAQKIERAKNIKGTFTVKVFGHVGNNEKTMQISKNSDSKFDFKYFYAVSLGFSLPEGFKADRLVVELLPKTKKAKTIKHDIDWQSLIKIG